MTPYPDYDEVSKGDSYNFSRQKTYHFNDTQPHDPTSVTGSGNGSFAWGEATHHYQRSDGTETDWGQDPSNSSRDWEDDYTIEGTVDWDAGSGRSYTWTQTYGTGATATVTDTPISWGTGHATYLRTIKEDGQTYTINDTDEPVTNFAGRSSRDVSFGIGSAPGPDPVTVPVYGPTGPDFTGVQDQNANPVQPVAETTSYTGGSRGNGDLSITVTHPECTFVGTVSGKNSNLRKILNAIIIAAGVKPGAIKELTFYGHGLAGVGSLSLGHPGPNNQMRGVHADGTEYLDPLRQTASLIVGTAETKEFFKALAPYLADNATIYLYGCFTGKGPQGLAFVQQVADIAGVRAVGYDNYVGLNGMRIPFFYAHPVVAYPGLGLKIGKALRGGPSFIGD